MEESATQPIEIEFKRLVYEAVREGLQRLKLIISDGGYIGTYFDWPQISTLPGCGLPSFYESDFSGPVDYKMAFQGSKPLVPPDELGSFKNLVHFIKTNEDILFRFFPKGMVKRIEGDSEFKHIIDRMIYSFAEELIDRYIHIGNTCEFYEFIADDIYKNYARSIFQDELFVDVYVPILFLKFSFDEIKLAPNIKIQKMDQEFQLARAKIKSYNRGVHDSVLSAATHALVLKNWRINNQNRLSLSDLFSDFNIYANLNMEIEDFFAALRIITGAYTGYAQILISPRGWALHYKANLVPLEGTSINAYPKWFENYYWLNEELQELNEDIITEISMIFLTLNNNEQNSIHIAANRLNLCFLRDDEDDIVLDAAIGLDALLLSENERSETTHKLAMRAGALAKISKWDSKSPYDVFKEVKGIYDYRSKIVHGSKNASKKREITSKDKERIPAPQLAVKYLRAVLLVLINNPKYLNPIKIDSELLLGSCSQDRDI